MFKTDLFNKYLFCHLTEIKNILILSLHLSTNLSLKIANIFLSKYITQKHFNKI